MRDNLGAVSVRRSAEHPMELERGCLVLDHVELGDVRGQVRRAVELAFTRLHEAHVCTFSYLLKIEYWQEADDE